MEHSYIRITEEDNHKFIVEAKLVNGTVWLSKWQMATIFNVYTKTIESSLNAIFKAGLLRENEVSRLHTFINGKHESEQALYNLDAIIYVGFRIASFEARAFREWVLTAFSKYQKMEKLQSPDVLIVLNNNSKKPFIASLN